jgi:hypothetical protein
VVGVGPFLGQDTLTPCSYRVRENGAGYTELQGFGGPEGTDNGGDVALIGVDFGV